MSSVRDRLLAEPYRFDFFQAVRLLGELYPDRFAVGYDGDPRRELVRFVSTVSFAFPPSEIARLEKNDDGPPHEMSVSFLGLASPSSFGSLPTCYTEELLERSKEKDDALRDFLDLFNHRWISLFYRAWEKHRLGSSSGSDVENPAEIALLSLVGLGTPRLRDRQSFDDRAMLSRAGVLARDKVSVVELEALLESYFDVPVEVDQFVPEWYPLESEEQAILGRTESRLGDEPLLGSMVRLCQFRFRIRLGPLSWKEYQQFLPTGDAFLPLVELIQFATKSQFDFDIQLVLRADETPTLRLAADPAPGAARLGWSAFAKSAELERDPSAILAPAV